jgi:anti-anti-sigma factor
MIEVSQNKDELIFKFLEQMGSKNSLEAEKLINDKLKIDNSPTKIIFDLKEVDYIASAFLRICIITAKKAGNEKFSIVNIQPQVRKIFSISGLEDFFDIS